MFSGSLFLPHPPPHPHPFDLWSKVRNLAHDLMELLLLACEEDKSLDVWCRVWNLCCDLMEVLPFTGLLVEKINHGMYDVKFGM